MDQRLEALAAWAKGAMLNQDQTITAEDFVPVSDDASFRRYFRCSKIAKPMIFMDAPPVQESIVDFVAIARMLANNGLRVPDILAIEEGLGFLALGDLGDTQLLSRVSAASKDVEYWLTRAMTPLTRLASLRFDVPQYSREKLQSELSLFADWYLDRYQGIARSESFDPMWTTVCETLIDSALSQPQVFVHRDYHSRNLMVLPGDEVGLLDFQDAVMGPVSYDLVSLLKDCYVEYDEALVSVLIGRQYEALVDADLPGMTGKAAFVRAFELMGLQRHLKCAGIFARLALRDGKTRYLEDVPRVLNYILRAVKKYPEFQAFEAWLLEQLPSRAWSRSA
jgi:aminoglycoside/choline kinase family phosphotransferase